MTTPSMEMQVAVARQPDVALGQAVAKLAHIFHDRVPRLVGETARTFFFELPSIHVAMQASDPDLIESTQKLLDIKANEIALWRRIEDSPVAERRFAIMLEHGHALEAWCYPPVLRPEPTLLLHIDAHDDLNAPSVRPTANRRTFSAAMGPGLMRLDDPKTVRSFVTRGYVGIGGFIAPMISAGALDVILHVSGTSNGSKDDFASLAGGVDPANGFICVDKHGPRCTKISYRRISLRDAIDTANRFDGRILLDVDLDAFCNRFDTRGGDYISNEEALRDLTEAEHLLRASGLPRRAIVTTVALSPGFFPAALWPSALKFSNALRGDCLNVA